MADPQQGAIIQSWASIVEGVMSPLGESFSPALLELARAPRMQFPPVAYRVQVGRPPATAGEDAAKLSGVAMARVLRRRSEVNQASVSGGPKHAFNRTPRGGALNTCQAAVAAGW